MTKKSRNASPRVEDSDDDSGSNRYDEKGAYDPRPQFHPYQGHLHTPMYYNQDYNPQKQQFSYAQAYPDVYSYNKSPYFAQEPQPVYTGMAGGRELERPLSVDEGYDDEEQYPSKKVGGKKKVMMKYIESKSKRGVTFSKRKKGIMKKAYELNILTGTQILLLIASESGHVYTFTTPKLRPIISEHEHLIQQCLNGPFPQEGDDYYCNYDPFSRDPSGRGAKRDEKDRPNDFYSAKK